MATIQQLIKDISRFSLTNRNILTLNKNIPILKIKSEKEEKSVLSKKKRE